MPSVFNPPQFPAHSVARGSRKLRAALALSFAFGSWSLQASAAPIAPASAAASASASFEASEPEPSAAEPSVAQREESYRGVLTASYVLAPFLALAVGHTLSESEVDDGVAVLGAGTMFLSPAVVHMAYGNVEHGPLSFLGLAGSTAVGTLVGGFVGYQLDSFGCEPAEDSDGCDFAGIGGLIVGSLIGGVTGYTGFAIYDVTANGAVELASEPPPDRASLQLWLSPLPAAKAERAAATSPFGGLQIGATLRM